MEISVPLGIGEWVRNRADAPSIPVINRFYEKNPANTDEQVALIERPALTQLLTAGGGPGRRLFRQQGFCGGDIFHVSGTDLYRHHMDPVTRAITSTHITGVVQGTGAPDMCASYQYLYITDGYTLQYTDGTAALQTISTSGIGNVAFSSIDIFDQYVLCVVANSDKFYWLQPSTLTFNALDFASAERFPDSILQIKVVGDEFWLLGQKSIEVWRATGDGNAPFERIEGRAFNFGVWGGTAIRMKDTSVIVVGDDGTVWNIAGVPQVISNPAIAEQTRNAILSAQGG